MNKRQVVPGGLLIPGGYPSVLLRLEPEPLGQVPILVALPVVDPLLGPVLQARDHRLRPSSLDRLDHGPAVVPLVGDDHLDRQVLDQRLCLHHVGRLARRQDQPGGQPEAADCAMNLRPEPASAAAEGLLVLAAGPVPFLGAPAAQGCARMMVESRINHSRSGSCRASNTCCQTPLRAQRSNRRQVEFQLPKRSGRSRHGAPVLATQRTASTKRRLSLATLPCWPGCPGRRSLILAQSSSEMAWRCRMAGPPWCRSETAINRKCPAVVHTT